MELVFKTLHNKSQYKFALITFFPLREKEVEHQSSFRLAIKKVLHSKQAKRFRVEFGKDFRSPDG